MINLSADGRFYDRSVHMIWAICIIIVALAVCLASVRGCEIVYKQKQAVKSTEFGRSAGN